jgi:hypothetical protein
MTQPRNGPNTAPHDPTRPLTLAAAAAAQQPPPRATDGDVWADLIHAEANWLPDDLRDACEARRALGIDRYGVPLGYDAGRDHTTDLVQELLDAAAYAWAGGRVTFARLMLTLALSVWRSRNFSEENSCAPSTDGQ